MRCEAVKCAVKPLIDKHDEWLLQHVGDKLSSQPERILNFGRGLNTFSDILSSMGHEVVPLDITDTSIANSPVVTYDGEVIPDELGNFDTGIVLTVLHHIPNAAHDNILRQLVKRCNRLIILEDVVTETTFVRTALKCMVDNALYFNHPLQFKRHRTWKEMFEKYGKVVKDSTDGQFSVFEIVRSC